MGLEREGAGRNAEEITCIEIWENMASGGTGKKFVDGVGEMWSY